MSASPPAGCMVVVTNTSIAGQLSIDDDLFRRIIMIYSALGGQMENKLATSN